MNSCHVCNKIFPRNDNLDRHKRYHCEFKRDESPKYKYPAPTKVRMERYNAEGVNSDEKSLGGTILTPEESLVWRKIYSADKDIQEVIKEFRAHMNYSKGEMTMLSSIDKSGSRKTLL